MKIKIDFQLSNQFNCLEKIIFKFVLNGFRNGKKIAEILPLCSDVVIAQGIKHLVNQQILEVKKEKGELFLSASLLAIMRKCYDNNFTLQISDSITSHLADGNYIVIEDNYIKKSIISEILPGVSLGLNCNAIDLILYSKRNK